jgi:hypothetical protein
MATHPAGPSPIILAVSMWMAWSIRPLRDAGASTAGIEPPLAIPSQARLRELGPRLSNTGGPSAGPVHQLVRFNLYNVGEQPVVLYGLGLLSIRGEPFECAPATPITVNAGARYPVMVEVQYGPLEEAVRVEVDVGGQRIRVMARRLPT